MEGYNDPLAEDLARQDCREGLKMGILGVDDIRRHPQGEEVSECTDCEEHVKEAGQGRKRNLADEVIASRDVIKKVVKS
jgi:hypothetical protein